MVGTFNDKFIGLRMDILTPLERSARMRLITSKNTKPELFVRRLIHGMGYRYRLHRRELPGKPDIVFVKKRKVIFVHGCFWHRHSAPSCRLARMPKSKLEYWEAKLERNALKDKENQNRLKRMGWKILVIWQCKLANGDRLKNDLGSFLEG